MNTIDYLKHANYLIDERGHTGECSECAFGSGNVVCLSIECELDRMFERRDPLYYEEKHVLIDHECTAHLTKNQSRLYECRRTQIDKDDNFCPEFIAEMEERLKHPEQFISFESVSEMLNSIGTKCVL